MMAHFEAHRTGVAFIVLDPSDVERIRNAAPNLYATFRNGRAAVEGTLDPFVLSFTPSWSRGHPIVALGGGANGIEVDPEAIGLAKGTQVSVSALTIEIAGERFLVRETEDSVRGRPTACRVTAEAHDHILEVLKDEPMHESAIRIMSASYPPKVVGQQVNALLKERLIKFDGSELALSGSAAETGTTSTDFSTWTAPRVGSGRPPVLESQFEAQAVQAFQVIPRPPRKALIEIKKFVLEAGTRGAATPRIVRATGYGEDVVRQVLNHLNVMGDVFTDEDLHRAPDVDGRSELVDTITWYVYDAPSPMSVEKLVSLVQGEFHPVWIMRTLDVMVKRKWINYDGTVLWFRMPDRYLRAPGIFKVKDKIEKAGAEGISIDTLHEDSDLPYWLIKNNVLRLAGEGAIAFNPDTKMCLWAGRGKNEETARPRHHIRDDIRDYIRDAGEGGLSRLRILAHFSDHPANKVSIALNELSTRGDVVRKNGVYRSKRRAPLELHFDVAAVS